MIKIKACGGLNVSGIKLNLAKWVYLTEFDTSAKATMLHTDRLN